MKNKKLEELKISDTRSLKEKLLNFLKSLLFWKGRRKGMIHTMDIEWGHLREIFFPKDFNEKYSYLGYIYVNEKGSYFNALLPLILTMDYYAKPRWCPRWFLRFLHVFGNDHSIVRVRNRTLHNLHRKLTKGVFMLDWKTKWSDYDLRISIYGTEQLQDLADDIEDTFYRRGRRNEILEKLEEFPEAQGKYEDWWSIDKLQDLYDELVEEQDKNL